MSSAARGQLDQLIRFWLSCPDDVLESLWAGHREARVER